jgi:hypothetical protein
MSKLYSMDQMHRLSDQFEEDGLTPEQVNMFGEGGRLRLIKAWFDGRAEAPKMIEVPEEMKVYLERLYETGSIVIPSIDGTDIPSMSKDVFDGWIDPDFVNWGIDLSSGPTEAQSVEVYELVLDGNFKTILESLGRPLDKLFFTFSQVKAFCRDHKDKLRTQGYTTFFPFKVGKARFVAHVFVDSSGLNVYVFRFSYVVVWYAVGRHRIVLPQKTLKS